MAIKFANEIITEIKNRGPIKIPNNNLTGNEFENWLRKNYKHNKNVKTGTYFCNKK